MIGALASPGLTVGLWLLCGTLVLAGALTFGELASRFPLAGGPYVYLRQGWGSRIAFLYGWQSLLILDPGVTAALASGLSQYLTLVWPQAAGAERWIAVGGIWTLAGISMAGLMLSARVLATITLLKICAFVAVVLLAFTAGAGSWSHFEPFIERHTASVPLGEALALGLVSVFFSFGGFWEASRLAGQIDDATRNLPAALTIGVAGVTTIYVALTVAFIYLVAPGQVTGAAEFARLAGRAMLDDKGAETLAWIVVVSVLASLLALLIMAPRLYVAMGSDGLFPRLFASVNRTTQAPVGATAVLAVLASVFVFVATFQEIVALFMCTTLSFIALAAATVFVVRRRGATTAPFQSPGYPVTPALFILLVAAVVALIAISRPRQALLGLVVVLLGVPAYGIFAKSHARGSQVST